jgi:hypothetical protein
MGRISNQYFGEGQAPTAPQLNAVYDSVAADDIEDVNLDTEWAQREHFSGSNSITSLYTFDYDGDADWTTTSTAFATIENVLGTPSKVLPNYSTHSNVVVRVHASGLIAETALDTDDGDGTFVEINHNTFAFRLFMSLNGSGTPTTVDVANCTYSFTTKAALTNDPTATTFKIYNRSFAFSGLYTLAPGNVIDSVELQACVGLANNTLNVQHNHIQVIIVEN